MAEVIDFRTRVTVPLNASDRVEQLPPNEKLRLLLKQLTQQADSGELQSLAFVGMLLDESVIEGWSISSELYRPYTLLGALEVVKTAFKDTVIFDR